MYDDFTQQELEQKRVKLRYVLSYITLPGVVLLITDELVESKWQPYWLDRGSPMATRGWAMVQSANLPTPTCRREA